MIYICLIIISAFACQASGKKYIIQTKNENGGTKPVEDRDYNPVEDRDSKPAVEYEGSKPVKKTDLGGSFGSDYMDGGSPTCFEDNTAYFRNDVRMGHKNLQPSHLACQKTCSDHPECVYWTWTKKTPKTCYLKHTRGTASPGLNSYISGPKQCLLPEANGQEIAGTESPEDRNYIGKLNEDNAETEPPKNQEKKRNRNDRNYIGKSNEDNSETDPPKNQEKKRNRNDRNDIGKSNEGKRIFFERKPEFVVSWNNLLRELPYLYKDFNITFDLLINKLTGGSLQNIIHFSTGGFDDAHEQYGDRCPAVWLKFDDDRFKLFVESAISGERKMNRKMNKKLEKGTWMNIEISQTMDTKDKYNFECKVDGRRYWNIENRKPADFEHVKIYAGNWYKTVDGRIRNITVETVDAEYRLNNPERYGHGRR